MIEAGIECLSQDELKLLDKQLELYVCLTSMVTLKDTDGHPVLGQDGRPVKVSAKLVCLPSLRESIISKCCYEVKEKFIVSFFENAGLRAAWERVSPFMPSWKPELREALTYIERIRLRVLRQAS